MQQAHAIIMVTICSFVLASCGPKAVSPAKSSPDGTMILLTNVNRNRSNPTKYLCVIIEIQDGVGNTLHREVTPASSTQRWSIQWINNDKIHLDSSDIGQYRIERLTDGTWKGELGRE